MSLIDTIRSATRSVVAAIGERWQYRTRTSAPGVEPQTFGVWTDVWIVATGSAEAVAYVDDADDWRERESWRVRMSDAVQLAVGDQVEDPAGKVWSVDARQTGAGGTCLLSIVIDRPINSAANRRGRP